MDDPFGSGADDDDQPEDSGAPLRDTKISLLTWMDSRLASIGRSSSPGNN